MDGIDDRLKELFPQIAADLGGSILEMEVMPDHVHLLVDIDPRLGIDDFVGSLKRRSSQIIGTEFPYMKKVQRDLYSAFLLMNSADDLQYTDRSLCIDTYDTFLANHDRCISGLVNSKHKLLGSFGISRTA